MADAVGLIAETSVERFSIIIDREADESGDVWMPISLETDGVVALLPTRLLVADRSNLPDELAAASAAALVRLAHLKMCVCKMM